MEKKIIKHNKHDQIFTLHFVFLSWNSGANELVYFDCTESGCLRRYWKNSSIVNILLESINIRSLYGLKDIKVLNNNFVTSREEKSKFFLALMPVNDVKQVLIYTYMYLSRKKIQLSLKCTNLFLLKIVNVSIKKSHGANVNVFTKVLER